FQRPCGRGPVGGRLRVPADRRALFRRAVLDDVRLLFGIGFAVQLRRAEARGAAFVPRYVRRLLALAAFGAFSHLVLIYHSLCESAVWALPLLLVRTWPVKRLVVALVISAASWSAYSITRTSLCVFDR